MTNLRPNEKRAKIAVILIWIVLAAQMAALVSCIIRYYFVKSIQNGEIITNESLKADDYRQLIISWILLIVTIVGAVTFIRWFRRAYFNMHVLIGRMRYTVIWAAGAWIVPIISLFRPHEIMKEMYDSAEELLEKDQLLEKNTRRVKIVCIWWAFWVVLNISSYILNWIASNASDLETSMACYVGFMIYCVLYIPLSILAVKVIQNYAAMEKLLPELNNVAILPTTTSTDLLDA
jgi:hypothetical protein